MVYRLVACMSSLEILDLTPSMKVGTSCTPQKTRVKEAMLS